MILCRQLAYQLASHHKRLLVGKTDGLACLDGMYRGRQSRKAHHCREHHVHRLCLNNLVYRLCSAIHLYVGAVGKERLQQLIFLLISNHHCCGVELSRLLGKQLRLVSRNKRIYLVQVAVLLNHLQCLCAYAAGRPEYGYLSFSHHSLFFYIESLCTAVCQSSSSSPSGISMVISLCLVSMLVISSSLAGISLPSSSSNSRLMVWSSTDAIFPTTLLYIWSRRV